MTKKLQLHLSWKFQYYWPHTLVMLTIFVMLEYQMLYSKGKSTAINCQLSSGDELLYLKTLMACQWCCLLRPTKNDWRFFARATVEAKKSKYIWGKKNFRGGLPLHFFVLWLWFSIRLLSLKVAWQERDRNSSDFDVNNNDNNSCNNNNSNNDNSNSDNNNSNNDNSNSDNNNYNDSNNNNDNSNKGNISGRNKSVLILNGQP